MTHRTMRNALTTELHLAPNNIPLSCLVAFCTFNFFVHILRIFTVAKLLQIISYN